MPPHKPVRAGQARQRVNDPGKALSHVLAIAVQKSFGVFAYGIQRTVQRHSRERHGSLVLFQFRLGSQNPAVFFPCLSPDLIGGSFAQGSREPLSEASVKPLPVQRIHRLSPFFIPAK